MNVPLRWLPLLLGLALVPHSGRRMEPALKARAPRVAPPQEPTPVEAQHFLDSALMGACQRNDFRAARDLLHRGADPNGSSEDGMPLLFDFVNGSEVSQNRALSFLLEHGADANGSQRWRPLSWAASMGGGARSIEILLAHGARIDDRDSAGQTALLDAASVCGGCGCTSNEEEALALIRHGANVNAVDHEGNTPLSLAIESGSGKTKLSQALLAHGASVSRRNENSGGALQLSRWRATKKHAST